MKDFEYNSGDRLFRLDKEHAVISVLRNGIEIDYIPNNYNREITKEEFIKLIRDYSIKN